MALFPKPADVSSVADELQPLIRMLTGGELPLGLRAWDGSRAGPPDAEVTVVVHSPRALQHLLWAPGELGLARAHVQGHLDIEGDVFALLGLRHRLADNGDDVSIKLSAKDWAGLARTAYRLGAIARRPPLPPEEAHLHGLVHSLRRDSSAIHHHYDVGNDFYRLILGPSLTYSCAYWREPEMDLADAQAAKYELICAKLGLEPGMRLLDVGCGWGSMVMHAALHHGVEAVGVTISHEQAELARRRVREAGLDGQVEIRVQDYRVIQDGPFDAISSIGMFEHVGLDRMHLYLRQLRSLLRPEGRLLNHAISRPDPDTTTGIDKKSFIGRYVFPDAALLEVGTVISAMQRVGLEVRDVQSLREHYDRTLRAWVTNLEARWDEAQQLVGPGRARVWRLYLAGSALGFAENRTSVHQVLSVRSTPTGISSMPRTREGLDARWEPIDLRHNRPSGTVDH